MLDDKKDVWLGIDLRYRINQTYTAVLVTVVVNSS